MIHRLPKSIWLDDVKYQLEWQGNGNMDGWYAKINIGRTFSEEPGDDGLSELDWFLNRNSEYSPCAFDVYPNGDVVCRVRV